MRISDLVRLAAKTLRGRWAALPVLGVAIGMFCLCFAGATITTVQQEKSLPYELSIAPEAEKITDSAIAEVIKIPEVTGVTPIITVPATVSAGDYTAELTLTGIMPEYLEGVFSAGGAFPKSSVMPYIVLNEAACKEFKSENDTESYYMNEEGSEEGSEDKAPDIDWLGAEFNVITEGSEQPVISSVCGILSNEEDEEEQQPVAYISISSAKGLLTEDGQNGYTGASVRIKNIGSTESVTGAIAKLGFTVSNADEELQRSWDTNMNEAGYLIVTGVFSIICSAVLIAAWKKISQSERRDALVMLRWIGVKERHIGRLFALQGAMISLLGVAAGIVVSVSLPSFLPVELMGASIYTLSVPLPVIAISTAICFAAVIIPLLSTRNSIAGNTIK